MPEGLWFSGNSMTRDLATITQRIRLLGFNAIRLPFSMQDLFNLSPKCVLTTLKCTSLIFGRTRLLPLAHPGLYARLSFPRSEWGSVEHESSVK